MAFLDPFDFMDDLVDIPLDLIMGSISGMIDEIGFGIDGMFANSVLDLSAINLDMSGLTDQLFSSTNSLLSGIMGEGGLLSNAIVRSVNDTALLLFKALFGQTDTLLTSALSILDNIAPDMTLAITDGLDNAFGSLGNIFDDITTQIGAIIEPLTEEFSFLNLSLDSFSFSLTGAIKGLLNIDIDEIADMSIKLNKKMLEARVEELTGG